MKIKTMKKTASQTEISKLDVSIHILNVLKNRIIKHDEYFKWVNDNPNDLSLNFIYNDFQDLFIINVCSFLDEIGRHFKKLPDVISDKEMVEKISLLEKEFKLYDGLHSFRNNFLAHNLRRKDEKYISTFLSEKFINRGYKLPQSIYEFQLISFIIDFFTDYINNKHPNSVEKVSNKIALQNISKGLKNIHPLNEEECKKKFNDFIIKFE